MSLDGIQMVEYPKFQLFKLKIPAYGPLCVKKMYLNLTLCSIKYYF